jgi:hypothetical protein
MVAGALAIGNVNISEDEVFPGTLVGRPVDIDQHPGIRELIATRFGIEHDRAGIDLGWIGALPDAGIEGYKAPAEW